MEILNDVVLAYQTQTTAWFNQLLPISRTIFALLATLEIGWSLASQQFFNLNPGEVLDQGLSLALELYWNVDFLEFLSPLSAVLRLIPVAVVLLAYVLMAIQVLRVLVEQYVVLGTGVFFFAFSGSRWSFPIADGLIRYSLQVGVRLFMMAILVGTGRAFGSEWSQRLSELTLIVDFRSYAYITVAALAFALTTWTLPERAAQAIAGSFSVGNPFREAA